MEGRNGLTDFELVSNEVCKRGAALLQSKKILMHDDFIQLWKSTAEELGYPELGRVFRSDRDMIAEELANPWEHANIGLF